jgi:hypothetical protein
MYVDDGCPRIIEDCTISSGVIGMYGAISRVILLPVMAAVMISLFAFGGFFFSCSIFAKYPSVYSNIESLVLWAGPAMIGSALD